MDSLLLFATTTGYQIRVFEQAAKRLGIRATLATDRCHVLADPWGDAAIPVRFENPHNSAELLKHGGYTAVTAVGDKPTLLAALFAEQAGLPYHPFTAVEAARDKHLSKLQFEAAGVRVARHVVIHKPEPPLPFPCVLKPLSLSGSRGVVRANTCAEFVEAFERIEAILGEPELKEFNDRRVVVEEYIPGDEHAVEGIVTDGQLQTLAIFDKPDPLEGPYFEETIYVTPSRSDQGDAIENIVQDGITALGLRHGPVHAEVRVNDDGVWLLEIAARPIGGLCAKALRFGADRITLEELILRHALGEDVSSLEREPCASGVMMIPVPASGVFRGVEGVEDACAVPLIEECVITAKDGQHLRMFPESSSYPGFLFARGETPADVEDALRQAHRQLRFQVFQELL